MVKWLVCLGAVVLAAVRCEPPVSSYLPPDAGPGAGRGRPALQYGPPGEQGGLGGQGAQGGRGQFSSTAPLGQSNDFSESFGQPSAQYGPPSRGAQNQLSNGPQGGFGRPTSSYGPPSQGIRGQPGQGFGQSQGARQPSSEYGPPGPARGPQRNQQAPQNTYSSPGQFAPSGSLMTEYGPPRQMQGGFEKSNNRQGSFGQSDQQGGFAQNKNQQNGFGRAQQSKGGSQPLSSYGAPSREPGRSAGFSAPESSYGPPSTGLQAPGGPQRFEAQQPQSSYGPPRSPGSSGSPGYPDEPRGRQQARPTPADEYGAPAGQRQRGGDDESNEPAKYDFSFEVDDVETGTKFGHSEQRDGDAASGRYSVRLPDGRTQVVQYQADRQGFKPQISYEGGVMGGFGAGGSGRGSSRGGEGYPRGSQGDNDLGYPRGGPGQARSPERLGLGEQPQSQRSQGLDTTGPGYPRSGAQGLGGGATGGYPRGSNAQQRSRNDQGFGNNQNFGDDQYQEGYPSGPNDRRNGPSGNLRESSGYPRGGPNQEGQGYSEQNQNDRSPKFTDNLRDDQEEGYPRRGPQGGAPGGARGGPQGGDTRGTGPRGGRGQDSFGDEGYPSGGPSGPRGSGY